MTATLPRLSGVFDKLTFIVSLQKQYLNLIIANFLLIILSNGIYSIIPFFTKLQIDQLEKKSTYILSFSQSPLIILFLLLLIPAGIDLLRSQVFDRFQMELNTKLNTKLRIATESLVWKKLLTLDAGFFLSMRNKQVIEDCVSSSSVVERFISFLSKRIGSLTGLLTIIPILAYISAPLMIIISIVAILQYLLNATISRYRLAYSLFERRQGDRFWRVRELLENNTYDLIASGGFDHAFAEYNNLRTDSDLLSFQRESANRKLGAVNWLLDNFLFISANLFVGYQVLQGSLSIGTFTLVVAYTSQISNILYTVLGSLSDWYYIDIDLEKLRFVFSLQSRLKTLKHPKQVPTNPSTIRLENVSFRYPNAFAEEGQYLKTIIEKIENRLVKKDSYYVQELQRWQDLIEGQKEKPLVLNDL